MKDIFSLEGKVAIVTGALGKLGPVWIESLLAAGSRVFALDHPKAAPSEVFAVLEKKFGKEKLHLARADALDKDALLLTKDELLKTFGAPDILVNNAGIDQPPAPGKSFKLEDIPLEMFMPTLTVNVYGLFLTTQVFGGMMARRGSGSVINIGSLYGSVSPDARFYGHIEGENPFIKPPAYGASKAAVLNLTKYFATHWGPNGVRVNAISPGGVAGGQDEEFKAKFNARVPLGRMAVDGDLAGPLIFLASDASSYVTGINLRVDGGFTAW